MPEGDTIFRTARTLQRALGGQVVKRFVTVLPVLARVDDQSPIAGQTIERVHAAGKHLLIDFSGGLTLRTHMRMNGSWHVYPAGARWQRPARDMRIVVATADAVAVGFNVPIAELLTSRDLTRHRELQALGPDLLGPSFDADDVVHRIRARGADAIGDVLLNQRVVAGIGNVFKSEILFLAGIHPFAAAASLSDEELRRTVAIAREQLAANVLDRSQTLSPAVGRRTMRSLNPKEKLWVYGRGSRPCRRCGSIVEAKKTGVDARLTYWCPGCQRGRDGRDG
jgi:endonuclease-8